MCSTILSDVTVNNVQNVHNCCALFVVTSGRGIRPADGNHSQHSEIWLSPAAGWRAYRSLYKEFVPSGSTWPYRCEMTVAGAKYVRNGYTSCRLSGRFVVQQNGSDRAGLATESDRYGSRANPTVIRLNLQCVVVSMSPNKRHDITSFCLYSVKLVANWQFLVYSQMPFAHVRWPQSSYNDL